MYETFDEAHSAYREFIREMTQPIIINGIEIDPARALAAADPTAYRCGFLDWLDGEGVDSDDLAGEDHSDPRESGFYASN
jgi:hypothetical protein